MNDDILYDLLPDLPRGTRALIRLAERVGRLETSLGDLTAEVSSNAGSVDDRISEMERRIRVLEGALEKTIPKVRETEAGRKASRSTQPRPEPTLYTAGGRRSHARQFRGVYCRNCAKTLANRQTVFCSRKCAKRWHDQHPGEVPQPRLTIEEAFETTIVAGVGMRDNGKEREAVEA